MKQCSKHINLQTAVEQVGEINKLHGNRQGQSGIERCEQALQVPGGELHHAATK